MDRIMTQIATSTLLYEITEMKAQLEKHDHRLDALDSVANIGRGAIWATAAIAGWIGTVGITKLLH